MPPPFPRAGVPGQSRMTANPARPVKRYRPGKAVAEEHSDSEEEDEIEEEVPQTQAVPKPPTASSFPASRVPQKQKPAAIQEDSDEDGFVTEDEDEAPPPATRPLDVTKATSVARQGPREPRDQLEAPNESEEEEEDEESEDESSEEESSSEEDVPQRKLLRPTFIKKSDRNSKTASPATATPQPQTNLQSESDTTVPAHMTDGLTEEEARRRELADMMITDKLERDALARAQGKKSWDDDEEVAPEDMVNDTDGIDPEAELAAWKLRELKRLKRDREAIELHEKELEEIERRRNLTAEEREKEDAEYLAAQKEERESGRGKAGFMQRYHHKGAFFQDEEVAKEILARRDLMGGKFVDEVQNREALPEYMQIRDMTKLGKKGRTKYKDLKAEDTGRWADYGRSERKRDGFGAGIDDERFRPDDDRARGDENSRERRSTEPLKDQGACETIVNAKETIRIDHEEDEAPRKIEAMTKETENPIIIIITTTTEEEEHHIRDHHPTRDPGPLLPFQEDITEMMILLGGREVLLLIGNEIKEDVSMIFVDTILSWFVNEHVLLF
ncbi:putative microfibrillar-associated protein 1 [Phaeomoniella chlamydospora]|uniref:Putative microfibrillar-associated protein 1 n=1 Tax=Phaeomoniella chlamydospora TaxID=158046 RepID=A0A0G2EFS9_PHACM|nr:putative microfibrillar-associated protein 1 [Phaeomoniella chlamydospora]